MARILIVEDYRDNRELPDASGFEVRDLLRADPATADVPVIAVTAHVRLPSPDPSGGHFDGVLTKPLSIRNFADQVSGFPTSFDRDAHRTERVAT